MKQYAWRPGFPKPPVSADVFGTVVDEIEARNGAVRPVDIVEEAQKPGSPIRAALQWDNTKAADAYRLVQARQLLGGLQIVRVRIEKGPEVSSRAMYRVRPDRGPGGYVSHNRIIGDRDLKKQVISSARRELESFLAKYAGVLALGAFTPRLQDAVDAMRDEIEMLETEANARRQRPREARAEPPVMQQAAE